MDLEKIQAFFFQAMVEGWATCDQKIMIAEMPGYKAIPFRDGKLSLLDNYCVNPNSPYSAGTTTIWHQDLPVWLMNYGGWYDKRAIAFLKRALSQTYNAHQFVGGRGPLVYTEGNLIYVNHVRLNDFRKFEGHEEELDADIGESLGFHQYWGMSLI